MGNPRCAGMVWSPFWGIKAGIFHGDHFHFPHPLLGVGSPKKEWTPLKGGIYH
jgi:hypothetical protein